MILSNFKSVMSPHVRDYLRVLKHEFVNALTGCAFSTNIF